MVVLRAPSGGARAQSPCGLVPQPRIEAVSPASEGGFSAKKSLSCFKKHQQNRTIPPPRPSIQQVPEVCGAFPSFLLEAGEDSSPPPDPPWKMSSVCWKERDVVAVRAESGGEMSAHRLCSAARSSVASPHLRFLLHNCPSSFNPTEKCLGFAASLGLNFLRRAPWVT